MIDGKQYVSIAVGWGGVFGILQRATELQSPGTVYTFAIDGNAPPPAFVKYQVEGLLAGVHIRPEPCRRGHAALPQQLRALSWRARRRQGRQRPKPRLRLQGDRSSNLKDFVFKGPFRDQGMPDFTGKLKEEDIPKLQAFIQGTADAIRPK